LILSGGPEASFTFDEIRLEPLNNDAGQPLLEGAEKTGRVKSRTR
jgi:hypothetical protein